MTAFDRLLLALAGLGGLLGVAASAAAAHGGGGETLKTAAEYLLLHAPLLVGLVALGAGQLIHGLLTRIAASAILLGLMLFSGDLALRALTGNKLFPMAAPSGGVILMLGWLLVVVAALAPVRR